MPLADRGTAILEELANEGIGERPVVFIAHSMGGILVKQILRHATSFGVDRWESIASRTAGVAFVATPHSGADLAGFAEIARLLLRTNEQVGELRAHHPRLRELHAWFLNFLGERKVVCRTFCETRELRPAVLAWLQQNSGNGLYTTAITVAEIRYGIARIPQGQRRESLHQAANEIFAAFPRQVLPFDLAAASTYADVVAGREKQGNPIDGFDAQIAAICRSQAATLATRNTKDFAHTGVFVVNPWDAFPMDGSSRSKRS